MSRLPLNPFPIGWGDLGGFRSDRRELALTRCRSAASLTDLSREFVLYTPALIYAMTPFPSDPMRDYVQDSADGMADSEGVEAFELKLQLQHVVTTVPEWENQLMAVPRIFWSGYERFLRSIFLQTRRGKICRFFLGSHWVPEPGNALLRAQLHYVGVDAKEKFCMLVQRPDGVLTPQWFRHREDDPLPKVVEAILRGETNPQDYLEDEESHVGKGSGSGRDGNKIIVP